MTTSVLEQFTVRTESGTTHEVMRVVHFSDTGPNDGTYNMGLYLYETSTGLAVKSLGDDKFMIVPTNEIAKRI